MNDDDLTYKTLIAEWGTNRVAIDRWRKWEDDPLPCYVRLRGPQPRITFKRAEVEAWRKRNLEPKAVK